MDKKILAIDDSGTVRQMISVSLKSAGYEVIEAVDGLDGLEKARAQRVDLVLIDQNMPKMDGLTLIQTLRSLPDYRHVPLLMLTTESGDDMKSRGREVGASGWIVKPFDRQKLIDVVKKVLDQHSLVKSGD